ncbi:hypothetical protein QL285_080875 [Trifolium repens]|nr:hypothetical protein QL285_080875 [Trifolium repens]
MFSFPFGFLQNHLPRGGGGGGGGGWFVVVVVVQVRSPELGFGDIASVAALMLLLSPWIWVFVCCCFWRSYWRGFVAPVTAPVEAMVVDLGVLGGGHEIWAIEIANVNFLLIPEASGGLHRARCFGGLQFAHI